MSRREATKEANRAALLDAAREVFAEYGYPGTGVRDIVRRTDLASGTFYNYFDSKEAIFAAVLEHGPVSAASLAARLGVTPAAVRRHLEALSEDGLIEPRSAPTTGRRGRPARVFVATERGQGAGQAPGDPGEGGGAVPQRRVGVRARLRRQARDHVGGVRPVGRAERLQQRVAAEMQVEVLAQLLNVVDCEPAASSGADAGRQPGEQGGDGVRFG